MPSTFTRILALTGILVLFASCSNTPGTSLPPQTTIPTVIIPTGIPPSTTPIPINTPPPTLAAPTLIPSSAAPTNSPSTTPAATLLSGYLDDRSTAIGVIQSLFNAINRKEYVRAYSYWESPGQSTQPGVPGSFSKFQQGYQDTASVQVMVGSVGTDAGAGQLYYSVPVALKAQTTGGQAQLFSGCYVLHLARPEIQDAPPFHPIAIFSAQLAQQALTANVDDLTAHGCDYLGTRQVSPTNPMPTTNPNDITSGNYLDDRSSPALVLRSLFNAINSKQYDRAYSYWINQASTNLPSYDQFKQGYANTASVELTFGSIKEEGAAGNFYFTVPAALKVTTTTGATQTFVGCYLEHMADPGVYGAPPYVPLGIEKANVQQVDNSANITDLLSKACANMP